MSVSFILPPGRSIDTLLRKISEKLTLTPEQTTASRQTCYDTFDWRFYQADLNLVREGKGAALLKHGSDEVVAQVETKDRRFPRFWADFPDGDFQKLVRKHADIRALMARLDLEQNTQQFRVLNMDEKTVVWLYVQGVKVRAAETSSEIRLLRLKSVRGYGRELQNLGSVISELGLSSEDGDFYDIAFRAAGLQRGEYSSKLNFDLSPEMSTEAATRHVLSFLYEVMMQNLDGVLADIDTEFLHDFRVALRRTRSAITQVKGALPDGVIARFKGEFSGIAKSTNQLRDLDVYLPNRSKYEDRLPNFMRPGLAPLFETLEKDRRRAFLQVSRVFKRPEFEKTLNDWRDFLVQKKSSEELAGKNAAKPVTEIAIGVIQKKYQRVLSEGRAISDDSPDSALHALRIQCKKLRYLMEFFASLFPADEIQTLIKLIKKLLDNLGDFNDLSVQQSFLHERLETEESGRNDPVTVAALGGLIAVLHQEQVALRGQFSSTFSEFDSETSRALFQKVFGESK